MTHDPKHVEHIFSAALVLSGNERGAFLDTACAGQAELRQRVEDLLRAHEQASGFLQTPAMAQLQAVGEATQALPEAAVSLTPPNQGLASEGTLARRASEGTLEETQAELLHKLDDDLAFLAPAQRQGSLGRLDHYEVLEVIGKGGFGVVLKAFDERLHRVVAVKVLSPAFAANGSARRRFIREAQAVAAIKNEHVVGIHDVKEDSNPPYLVMECIDGFSLQQKIDKQGALGVKEILRIGTQIAEGLAAAHKQGKVHRDIKPANILLENGVERVKITDFGLARAVDDASVTQSGTVAGTPMYMSPEQAEGLPIDHRSDLFSLGTVLYAMCTGHPPFRASGTHAVLKRVIDASPRPIREINCEIPDWLCDIIAKLHAKKPEDRYQIAKEVAELLGQRLADVQAGREIGQVIDRRAEPRKGPGAAPATDPATRPLTRLGSPNRRRLKVALVLLVLFFVAAYGIWRGPAIKRFASGQARLFVTRNQLDTRVFVKKDGRVVQEIGGKAPVFALDLESGGYEVSAECPPGFRPRWVVTTDEGVFSPFATARTRLTLGGTVPLQPRPGGYYSIHVGAELIPKVEQEPSWVQLFNGKDLTGWKSHPDQPGDWQVKGGILVGRATQAPGHLFSERGDFENFHFRVEAKLNESGDSGQIFRCEYGLNGAPMGPDSPLRTPLGYEANLSLPTDFKTGSLWGASISPVGPKESLIDPETWFVQEVIAQGNRIIVKVNGKTSVEVIDTDSRYLRGHLALQAWVPNTVVHFKKVEIKELPAEGSPPPHAVAPFDAAKAKEHQDAWAKHLGVPVEFENKLGMKFRLIPPGEYTMGSTPAEIEAALQVAGGDARWRGHVQSEGPQHMVVLKQPVYMSVHEVTQKNYQAVMGTNPSFFAKPGPKKDLADKVAAIDTVNHPVENVRWHDAAEFCIKLCQLENLKPFYGRAGDAVTFLDGRGYRLPTEAEWEFACRAGTTTRFWCGDRDEELPPTAWIRENSGGRTHPVGELKANPFGLYDMHGHVWEWVQDWWEPNYYFQFAKEPAIDPQGPPSTSGRRVIRGGHWSFTASICRSSDRFAESPAYRGAVLGFRVALSVDAVKQKLVPPATELKEGQKARSSLDGRWHFVAAEYQGKPVPAEEAKDMLPSELIFTANQFGITWAGKKHEGSLRIDASKKPAEIDFTGSVFAGLKPRKAIYELDGDRLKLCLAFVGPNADPPRPTSFTTDPDSKNVVLTYRREASGEKFVPLFNAKDLAGWKITPGHAPVWSVKDGVLVGKAPTPQEGFSFLGTERQDFGDFHLRAEVRIGNKGNSGIYFRATSSPAVPEGYEAQIRIETGVPDLTGSLGLNLSNKYQYLAPVVEPPHEPDRWSVLEVIAQGDRLETRVDGKTVATYKGATRRSGGIFLEASTTLPQVEFRKIEIKELPAGQIPPPAIAPVDKKQAKANQTSDRIQTVTSASHRCLCNSVGQECPSYAGFGQECPSYMGRQECRPHKGGQECPTDARDRRGYLPCLSFLTLTTNSTQYWSCSSAASRS